MKGRKTILLFGVLTAIVLIFLISRKRLGIVWDPFTEIRLQQLAPEIRDSARAFINEAESIGIFLRIPPDGAFRSFSEQKSIYDKGRTAPGKIVTYAKPGQSYHNYGLALDVVEINNGSALWENPQWWKIGALGKKHGFAWGGEWSNPDYPHFEKSFGYSTNNLLAMKNAGQIEGNYIKLS